MLLHSAGSLRQLVLPHRGTETDNPTDIYDNANLHFVPCPSIGCAGGVEVGSFSLDDYESSSVAGLRASLTAHKEAGFRFGSFGSYYDSISGSSSGSNAGSNFASGSE